MPSYLPFTLKMRTAAQRARIARRRERQNCTLSDAELDARLLDELQRTVNTHMNGIVGALEMIRKSDLAPDQSEMISLAQNSADHLLSDIGQLLELNQDTIFHAHEKDTPQLLSDIRMMLIDTDAGTRERIEKELKQYGASADGFDLPNAALLALEQAALGGDPYRIVILDQQIPGMDGETLGTAIVNTPLHRDTLIVLLSDEHDRHDADRLTLAGFSAWLPKPVSRTMLVDTLTMLCSCIARKDAPRFICAGVRVGSEQPESLASFAHSSILVVDDHAVNLQVAQQMLACLGCQIDTASSGQQALQLVSEQRYDLILMDCQMPQMDGYQTTALLRATEAADFHTIIIGWSAGARHQERDTCLAIGMDDFMTKPLRIRALNDMLTRWLKPARVAIGSATPADDELDTTRQMFGDDFPELAHLFLEDSPKRLLLLEQAVAGQDAIAIAKFAHILCGSSASIGASTLAALCRDMEICAKNNAIDEAPARLPAIELEYARIDAKLHHMLDTGHHAESPGAHDKH